MKAVSSRRGVTSEVGEFWVGVRRVKRLVAQRGGQRLAGGVADEQRRLGAGGQDEVVGVCPERAGSPAGVRGVDGPVQHAVYLGQQLLRIVVTGTDGLPPGQHVLDGVPGQPRAARPSGVAVAQRAQDSVAPAADQLAVIPCVEVTVPGLDHGPKLTHGAHSTRPSIHPHPSSQHINGRRQKAARDSDSPDRWPAALRLGPG